MSPSFCNLHGDLSLELIGNAFGAILLVPLSSSPVYCVRCGLNYVRSRVAVVIVEVHKALRLMDNRQPSLLLDASAALLPAC